MATLPKGLRTMFEHSRSGHTRAVSVSLLGFALAFALAPSLAGQETNPGIFGEVLDVRVVNLEVVVTDRQGNRVSGLKAEDFELKVDGKPVGIDYFTEVLGGTAVEGGGSPGLPALKAGAPVGTSYLVFIDDFFPIERDRNRVIEALRGELPLLNPEDRMAVVAFDGRRLTMLTSWSQAQPALDRALQAATRRPAFGLTRRAEARQLTSSRDLGAFERVNIFAGGDLGRRLNPEERAYVQLVSGQVQRVLAGASATLRSFAMPPGRKVMMLLSGGWPFDPTQAATQQTNQPVLDSEFDRGADLYAPLANTANLLGYTVYPIDVAGLEDAVVDASQQTPSDPGTSATQTVERESESTLTYLARRTGGEAMLNARRLRALGQAASDTRSYYWLGFSPQRAFDDVKHRLEVDVKKPGLRVRSRRDFLDLSRKSEVTAMVESTLLFGSAPSSGALPIQLRATKPAGRGKVEIPLIIAIPVDAISLVPVGDKYVAELELRIAALDRDGNQAEIPVIPISLSGTEAPKAGSFVRYDTSVKLRKSPHEVVVSIFDPASGRLLTNRFEVKP